MEEELNGYYSQKQFEYLTKNEHKPIYYKTIDGYIVQITSVTTNIKEFNTLHKFNDMIYVGKLTEFIPNDKL